MIAVVNSVEIGFDDVGTATSVTVLFVHAFPLNRTMWAPQVSAKVERCRCIAADGPAALYRRDRHDSQAALA